MSHKVHPVSYRRRRIADWDSRGFYKDSAKTLEEDFKIRKFIQKKLAKIGLEKIEIERFTGKTNIIISSSKPGLIIGRGGEGVERLKNELENKIMGKKSGLRIEIREIKNPWSTASLSAQWAAQQIEKRVPFRRVLKMGLQKIMESSSSNEKIKGARIEVSGRLNGAEIARREWLAKGQMPRQTIRADIDYALVEARCSYGVIGVKVWLYKGEKFE